MSEDEQLTEEQKEEQEQKKKERNMRIALTIIGAILMGVGALLLFYAVVDPAFLWLGMIGGMILLMFAFNLLSIGLRPPPPLIQKVNTVTVIKCYSCDYTEIRDFKKGDYIFKELGECPKCSGVKYIKTIYTISPEKNKKQ
ncbi:MAG: hypothetical protein ACTSQY_07825 [Candidatus Odinarchaeia archaeon]